MTAGKIPGKLDTHKEIFDSFREITSLSSDIALKKYKNTVKKKNNLDMASFTGHKSKSHFKNWNCDLFGEKPRKRENVRSLWLLLMDPTIRDKRCDRQSDGHFSQRNRERLNLQLKRYDNFLSREA